MKPTLRRSRTLLFPFAAPTEAGSTLVLTVAGH